MNILREIVGGPKNRFKEEGFNLDLTYITSKIIAMAFPASGIQKMYRNSIDVVSDFLKTKHKNQYMILNISCREIDEKKLKNVYSFQWEDHKVPPLEMLFHISALVAQFLSQTQDRVVVIHCNHGKGRTGTLICCLLLYLGAMPTVEEAMAFYAKKRFENGSGLGVTQPCQIQYINYFFDKLKKPTIYPRALALKKIIVRGGNQLDHPYFKVKSLSPNQYIFNTHKKQCGSLVVSKQEQLTLCVKEEVYLAGDIVIEIKQEQKIGKNLTGTFSFNTAFIPFANSLLVPIKELSPLSTVRAAGLSSDFCMEIHFKEFCKCDPALFVFEGKCEKCKIAMKVEHECWQKINKISEDWEDFLKKNPNLFGNLEQPPEMRLKRAESMPNVS